MSHSQLGSKPPCNCNLWSCVATMGQFQWMPHLPPIMWNFHMFILMDFVAHHIGMPMPWIITSWQKCEDLVEWLNPHRAKLLSPILKWELSYFIVDDAPQELCALQWILNSFHLSFVFSSVLMCTI
jgi:hypothetical protein